MLIPEADIDENVIKSLNSGDLPSSLIDELIPSIGKRIIFTQKLKMFNRLSCGTSFSDMPHEETLLMVCTH
jgi:hypothetical protein